MKKCNICGTIINDGLDNVTMHLSRCHSYMYANTTLDDKELEKRYFDEISIEKKISKKKISKKKFICKSCKKRFASKSEYLRHSLYSKCGLGGLETYTRRCEKFTELISENPKLIQNNESPNTFKIKFSESHYGLDYDLHTK